MTTGDKLWSDNGSRAELHIGSASLRIGSTTGFSFLNLTDNVAQVQLTEGTLRVRVKRLEQNETFEIDTPNLAFSVLRPGTYRVDVNESGDSTVVAVMGGEGEVTGGGQAYSVHAGQTATFQGTDQLDADVQSYGDQDNFDQWCADRDRREDRSVSARYVSDDAIGYEDLDDYGGWRPVPDYGQYGFRTLPSSAGLRTATDTGFTSHRGAIRGLKMSPGALRPFTMAAGLPSVEFGAGCRARLAPSSALSMYAQSTLPLL
jgi:hypothetical protein